MVNRSYLGELLILALGGGGYRAQAPPKTATDVQCNKLLGIGLLYSIVDLSNFYTDIQLIIIQFFYFSVIQSV